MTPFRERNPVRIGAVSIVVIVLLILAAYRLFGGILGILINGVFSLIERRALRWHQSVRGEDVL